MGSLWRGRLLPVLLLAGATACRLTTDWDVAEDSRPFAPVFLLRNTFGVPVEIQSGTFGVETCPRNRPSTTMWLIHSRYDGSKPRPYRIPYGEAPWPYVETAPARPLQPGCYLVGAGGTPYSQFQLDSAGIAHKIF